MTQVDIEKLRGLMEKATKGTWKQGDEEHSRQGNIIRCSGHGVPPIVRCEEIYISRGERLANAELIVTAINSLPSILDELTRSRQAMKELEERIDKILEREKPNITDYKDDINDVVNAYQFKWRNEIRFLRDSILKKFRGEV